MCDYPEGPRCWSSTNRIARKRHRCCACGEAIHAGHTYRYSSGVWDTPDSFKHCLRCWAIIQAIIRRTDRDDPVDLELGCGEVWNEPPDEVAALAFATYDEMLMGGSNDGRRRN